MSTWVLLKSIKGHRWTLAVTALLVVGFGVLLPTSYTAFGPEYVEFLTERMPAGMSALLKAEGSLLLSAGAQGHVAIGFRHPLFLIVLCAFAISLAAAALAREVERRTILMLLSRPLPRHRLVTTRGLEAAMVLVVLVAALLAGIHIGLQVNDLTGQVHTGPLVIMGFNGLALGLAVLGYSFLFSAVSSEGGRATLLATGTTVAFFFVDFLSTLFEEVEALGYVTIFHYFDPVSVAADASFPGRDVGVLLGVAGVTFAAAVWAFQRRDIAA